MLKWIPAACVGGWAGLFGKAAALPAAAKDEQTPASDKLKAHQYESPIATDPAAGTYTYSYTQYDDDGRVVLESWSDGVVTHCEYPMP